MALHQAVGESSRCEELIYTLAIALKPLFCMVARTLGAAKSPLSERLDEHREYVALIESAAGTDIAAAIEDFYRRMTEKIRLRG